MPPCLKSWKARARGEVAFDVDFSSMSNDAADRIFAEALHRGGGSVILPAFKQRTRAGERDRFTSIARSRSCAT